MSQGPNPEPLVGMGQFMLRKRRLIALGLLLVILGLSAPALLAQTDQAAAPSHAQGPKAARASAAPQRSTASGTNGPTSDNPGQGQLSKWSAGHLGSEFDFGRHLARGAPAHRRFHRYSPGLSRK